MPPDKLTYRLSRHAVGKRIEDHGQDEVVGNHRCISVASPAINPARLRISRMSSFRVGNGTTEIGRETFDDTIQRLRPGHAHVDGIGVLLTIKSPALFDHKVVDVIDIEFR